MLVEIQLHVCLRQVWLCAERPSGTFSLIEIEGGIAASYRRISSRNESLSEGNRQKKDGTNSCVR